MRTELPHVASEGHALSLPTRPQLFSRSHSACASRPVAASLGAPAVVFRPVAGGRGRSPDSMPRVSGSIGIAMTVASVLVVNRFLDGFRLVLGLPLIAVALTGAITIATLSGLYPAWRASKMTPMDAIRRGGPT